MTVVPFKVPPKTLSRKYKGIDYKVTYIPSSKEWMWTVTKVSTLEYSETCKTQKEAIRAAEKFIDSIS